MSKANIPVQNLPIPALQGGLGGLFDLVLPWIDYFQSQFYRIFFFVIDLLSLVAGFKSS